MNTVLQSKALCKSYVSDHHAHAVLKNVDLTIREGEMVAIMGPSGSGKSTLLYCVSGMDRPSSGSVVFNGREIDKLKDKELATVRLDEMGFIFQQMYMMKNLSVLDNIILPAVKSKKGKESRKAIEARGKELMKKLGIEDVWDKDINEVSGGQLQRACICRSLINNPKLIFADEPTGALNRANSDEVMRELLAINESGTTILLVTHDPKVAAKCGRVLYIVDGEIVGEIEPGRFEGGEEALRERERSLNDWLMERGW